MTTYFIKEQDCEAGPFTIDQLKIKLLNKEAQVWHAALKGWTMAGNVFELKELFEPAFASYPFGKNTPGKIQGISLKQQFKKITLLAFLLQIRK
ncbi:DUF4339 domain-containing protein [Ginsengibacter hankyongi]|uniref:DUF4339 domain-containing protein n=1 Tax=Ginsengibacter hankyongi TaxID=2607284 RepID=A0A5J5IM57_9BACT|nr:DUF4339 domain-containing protein [Ginsengibacter hankyongi]KAA9041821.1 DUF4339 domain-containing protein [Ginsengibacter hankyongi]